ncbi:MAG: ABC-2 family transporter protein [Bdellovibrionales bacterium]|nr:ABC-2 family transporter protein [Bdellovibrionales bacterium]
MSFIDFWKRNLALFKLAIVSNMEYRVNFLVDALIQPLATGLVEAILWMAVFASITSSTVAGFAKEFYLSYAIWGAFITRIATNWMYEHRMIQEVDTGSINAILSRPISFFEYYLSQYIGYKMIIAGCSLFIPLAFCWAWHLPFEWNRLPGMLLLVTYYLIFSHLMSFCIACCAFFWNRVYNLTAAKNLFLWLLTGELFPLDLIPEPYRSVVIDLPFASAVYVPVGYVTGRLGEEALVNGFVSVTGGILLVGLIAKLMWRQGLLRYSGTGA